MLTKMYSPDKKLIVGVDIGGSHITGSIIDRDLNCTLKAPAVRRHVDTNGNMDEILSVWSEAIAEIIKNHPPQYVLLGIAMPGPFDYENGISLITKMNKYESLYGVNVKSHLCEKLGLLPVNIIFRNDAEAFLHGEVHCGAATGIGRAIGITLGTGLGSAISIDGITKDSNLGVSFFKDGIAEDYLSTRWFVKRYFELTGSKVKDTKALVDLYDLDPVIPVIFNDFSRSLGDFLSGFAAENKAEVIVIGGNIAKCSHLFLEKTRQALSQRSIKTELRITELWEHAAMIGAAYSHQEIHISTS